MKLLELKKIFFNSFGLDDTDILHLVSDCHPNGDGLGKGKDKGEQKTGRKIRLMKRERESRVIENIPFLNL